MLRICTAVWVVALGLAAAPASAQTSDDFFNQQALQTVELWMHSADWEKLKQNFQENTYYPADMTCRLIRIVSIDIDASAGTSSSTSWKKQNRTPLLTQVW